MLANCWGFRWYANLFGWWKKSLKMNYYRHCCFTSINLDFYQNHWHVIWREYWQPSKGEIRPNATGHTHTHTHTKAQTHRYTRKMCIYSLNILSENYLSQINRGKNLFHGKTWKMPYCKYLRDGIYIENLFFHAFFFYGYIYIALMICYESWCFLYKHTAHKYNCSIVNWAKSDEKKNCSYLQWCHIRRFDTSVYLKTTFK